VVRPDAELDVLIARAREGAGAARPVLVALDGRSGVGKTRFAGALASRHGGAAILADDFFAGGAAHAWSSLSPAERASTVIDWRRLRAQVLEPLLAGRTARWRTFGWERGSGLSERVIVQPAVPVIVLDGAYSTRPELCDLVNVSVLLTLKDAVRRERLIAREGLEYMREWHALFDDAEEHYFNHVRPAASFDIIIRMD
jgi:uridine kinase